MHNYNFSVLLEKQDRSRIKFDIASIAFENLSKTLHSDHPVFIEHHQVFVRVPERNGMGLSASLKGIGIRQEGVTALVGKFLEDLTIPKSNAILYFSEPQQINLI